MSWYGHSCFRLAERGKATIVTDAFDESIGYSVPKLKADVVTVSHNAPGHSSVDNVKNFQRLVNGPGEYEIGGVVPVGAPIINVQSKLAEDNIHDHIDFDGLVVRHLSL